MSLRIGSIAAACIAALVPMFMCFSPTPAHASVPNLNPVPNATCYAVERPDNPAHVLANTLMNLAAVSFTPTINDNLYAAAPATFASARYVQYQNDPISSRRMGDDGTYYGSRSRATVIPPNCARSAC